jgi:mannose/fructose/N-acetylgalactosamine-specific phosphotransferase system component IIC
LEQVFLLSTVGAALALDNAMLGQFMVSQPLVVGTLFGALMGNLPMGLATGALVQLLWLGVLPVGAYVPSDHTVTGGATVALTLWFIQRGLAPEPSVVAALALSIPAGVLAGQLDIAVRHGINDRLARYAEKIAESGVVPPLGALQVAALAPSFLRSWLIYLLWLGPGALLASRILVQMPEPVLDGLRLAFWALPALAFAVLFELARRERWQWWALGTFGVVLLALWIQPEQLWRLLGLVVAFASLTAWWRGGRA